MVRKCLDVVAAVAMISASAFMIWTSMSKSKPAVSSAASPAEVALPKEPQELIASAFLGSREAPVVVTAFSDFECVFCGKFARETFPELKRDYIDSGKVLFAFRHFPLEGTHPFAKDAARASNCAARQGKFWEIHDGFFRDRSEKFSATTVAEEVQRLGLDRSGFDACAGSKEVEDQVSSDMQAGRSLGVVGTPTFVVGRRVDDTRVRFVSRLNGARSTVDFRSAIDALLRDASGQ